MAKRRKTRTHKADTAKATSDGKPKSFVLHAGQVGGSVKQLSRDLRQVMEPNTAARLRERKSNKIKDFIAMSGPLHVTHLMVLAQSDANKSAEEDDKDEATSNVNLRITRLPRGPSLGFKILRYALVRDVLAATKRPRSPGKEFATEPMLILNNFSAAGNPADARQLTLMQTMFQNLFPPIRVHSMPLSAARRVVLLSYNATTRTIDFRHYLISVRPVGVTRSVRKIIEGTTAKRGGGRSREGSVYSAAATSDASGSATHSFAAFRAKGMPDLRNAQDISDYVLNHGDMGFLSSASEAESDASGAEEDPVTGENSKQVVLPSSYMGRANRRIFSTDGTSGGEKRAVRLTELGPRMELGLVKIEDGIGDGKGDVLFHEFIHKTAKEAAAIARRAKEKEKLAKARRAEQEANVKRKKEQKDALKAERERKKREKIKASAMGGVAEGEESDAEVEGEDGASEDDEFEYEDMFADDDDDDKPEAEEDGAAEGADTVEDDAVDAKEDDEELFDEASEAEYDEEEEDDDSDLSPIPYNSGDESEEDDLSEAEAQAPNAKKARFAPEKTAPSRGKPAFRGQSGGQRGGGGGRGVGGGRGGKPKFSMRGGRGGRK